MGKLKAPRKKKEEEKDSGMSDHEKMMAEISANANKLKAPRVRKPCAEDNGEPNFGGLLSVSGRSS